MLITKSDGGHLRGIPTLGGLAYLIRIAAMMTMKRAANTPTFGLLIAGVMNFALLAAVLRPAKSALKDYVSPAFAHLAFGPHKVSFQS